MIHEHELACGCIDRDGKRIHECGKHRPLSFSRAQSLEVTQPIPALLGSGSTVAPEGYGERSALGMLGDVLFGKALPFALTVTDARGSHTLCEFTREQRDVLLQLVLAERIRLLHERRVYVLARKGDPNRFTDLLAGIDQQLDGINPLCDKLKGRA